MLMNSKWHCNCWLWFRTSRVKSLLVHQKQNWRKVEHLCLKTSLLNIIRANIKNELTFRVCLIYRSLESQQSLKCWNLKTFRMKKCLEDTNIKSTIQTFDLVCFPEGEQLFWTIILSNFEMSKHDVLIWYLANPIKMNS